ncbi:MAG: hypothetical protein JJE04_20635 [Acidobacteriia bacterium]|nr:hypothetical protein [Terriglobia bacterium]
MRQPLLALTLLALLCSCSKSLDNKDAIRQSVIDHLSSRKGLDLDLKAMDVDVTSINFRANEADAVVNFRPKGAAGAAGMEMKYTLERKGDRWAVKSKAEAGGNPHAAPSPGGMSGDGAGGGAGALPPGHPPMMAPSQPEKRKGPPSADPIK